jgi:hypothetical protein
MDASIELDDADFGHFRERGARRLFLQMMEQSLQDLLALRMKPGLDDPDGEIAASAEWLSTEPGMECIAFVMPGVHPSRLVARVYEDPDGAAHVLAALKSSGKVSARVESGSASPSVTRVDGRVDPVVWAEAADAVDGGFDAADHP